MDSEAPLILDRVASVYGTTVKDIRSKSRFREHVDARHIAARLLSEARTRSGNRKFSNVAIGDILNMDRTTVGTALELFDDRMRYNDKVADCYRHIVGPHLRLPFPPSSLSGHHNEHWRLLGPVKKKHREWARLATLEAKLPVPETGDIPLHIRFVPPDNRGDRTNYWNRCKAYIDGIAEGLGLNDKRFLPSMSFAPPQKPGRVEVTLG